MPSARGNNNDGSTIEYEEQRLTNIERNKRRLAALNVSTLVNTMADQGRSKRISKKKHNPSIGTSEQPNLRPRSQRNNAQLEEEHVLADMHPIGDFLNNNEDPHIADLNTIAKEKSKGRGVTKNDDIFSRTPDMPKIKILLNDHGQPVGKNARQLSSVIGCQVKKKISLASVDWRLVSAEKKYELWTDIKVYYDIEDAGFNWVMRTAGRKWKEFKATMKESYFHPEMSIEAVGECPDKRVNDDDWKFLVNYWMSSEFQDRSKIAKANRAKLQLNHTAGSDLAVKLGRPPRRDENFIKTHTTVCGEKEPRGYVRVLGLGPTPQDVSTLGLKSFTPTRLQMEIFSRMKAQSEKTAMEHRILQLQAQMEQNAQDSASAEPMSQHGSTSHQHPNVRMDEMGGAREEQGNEDEDYPSGDDGNIPEFRINKAANFPISAPIKNHLSQFSFCSNIFCPEFRSV